MYKIIFLDIDGVLNGDNTEEETKSGCMFVEDRLIRKLKRIISATKAKVVLSSDWRYHKDEPILNEDYLELQAKLEEYGIEFFGWTPVISQEHRGLEIDAWLKKRSYISSFVILDDRFDMHPHNKNHVKVGYKTGLTDDDVEEAINILNGTISAKDNDETTEWLYGWK
jgi:hypothetical protein